METIIFIQWYGVFVCVTVHWETVLLEAFLFEAVAEYFLR